MSGRLPALRPDDLNDAQRALYERLVAGFGAWADKSGFDVIASDGSLLGPLNPLLLAPRSERRRSTSSTRTRAVRHYPRVSMKSSSSPSGRRGAATTNCMPTAPSEGWWVSQTMSSRRSSPVDRPTFEMSRKRAPTSSLASW
jgi:hypothetical protein